MVTGGSPDEGQVHAAHRRLVIRNGTLFLGSAAAVAALLLYPTSRGPSLAAPRTAASGGVIPLKTDLVVTGRAVATRYGPVQVRLLIRNGKIISADAVKYPMDGGLSTIVSGRAVVKLDKEVLAAQTGQIDVISTATYTSDGYRTSLQAALDQAHLG